MTPRLATLADLDTVTALIQAAYAPWVPILGQTPRPMVEDYGQAIADNTVYLLPNACIELIDQDDHLLLANVAVHPDAQGQGLGSVLMAFAETEARRRGHPAIRLFTHEKMASNLTLYERAGYVRLYHATEHGLPRIYMEKRL